eukprot:291996_1
MSNSSLKFNYTKFSVITSIAYFSIYGLAILIASIYCFIKVRQGIKSKQINNTKCYHNITAWWRSLSKHKSIYIALIPHLFDQATDCGLIIEWYFFWKYDNVPDVDMGMLVVSSIGIIILHRIISGYAVYILTRKPIHVIIQLFELMIIKAIYVNYRVQSSKPSNPQRYLQLLESIFESGPQLLLSTGYAVKTRSVSLLLLLSLVSSLWNITNTISSDDKQILPDDCQTLHIRLDAKATLGITWNWDYLLHSFGYRFLEITCRIFILVMIWVNFGGLAMFIIIIIEFIWLSYIAWNNRSMDFFSSMLCISPQLIDSYDCKQYRNFIIYRILSQYLYLIGITYTVFATKSFSCPSCGKYEDRHYLTAALSVLIYTWIGSFVWPYLGKYFYNKIGKGLEQTQLVRDPNKLDRLKWAELVALFEFGVPIPANDIYKDGHRGITIIHRICEGGPLSVEYLKRFIQIAPE